MDRVLVKVASSTQVKAFVPFTPMPAAWAKKVVQITICDDYSPEQFPPDADDDTTDMG